MSVVQATLALDLTTYLCQLLWYLEHWPCMVTAVILHTCIFEMTQTLLCCRQYLVIKVLGSGQYGKVQLVVNVADLQPYAIKTVSKAKLRTSIRRIRSSLSRHSYGSLNFAASQAIAASNSDPPPEPQKAPPPPTDLDSSPSSASSLASSSPFAGMPNIPGGELFTTAPPNSRFGGGSRKSMQLNAAPPAAAAAVTSGTEAAAAATSSEAPVSPVLPSGQAGSPFVPRQRLKLVSPFAAAAQASLKVLTATPEDTDMAASGSSSLISPRLRSTLGGAQLDPELSSLGTSFGRHASPQGGHGESLASLGSPMFSRPGVGDMNGAPGTARPSLAERPMPRPSVERVAQLRGYGAPADSDADSSYGVGNSSPRNSLADQPVGRPSLEHIAHLRGFARANSTPNTGLADSFSMSRSASIRTTPRAADVVQEIAVMKKLNHPNIVRLYEVCISLHATIQHCQVVSMCWSHTHAAESLMYNDNLQVVPVPTTTFVSNHVDGAALTCPQIRFWLTFISARSHCLTLASLRYMAVDGCNFTHAVCHIAADFSRRDACTIPVGIGD